jgi:hypothetical protein
MAATGPKKVESISEAQAKLHAVPKPDQPAQVTLSTETIKQLRTFAHDLSNSIETIMQASYLLSQGKLDETNQKWAGLVDQAARDAARINRDIRDVLRSLSEQK